MSAPALRLVQGTQRIIVHPDELPWVLDVPKDQVPQVPFMASNGIIIATAKVMPTNRVVCFSLERDPVLFASATILGVLKLREEEE